MDAAPPNQPLLALWVGLPFVAAAITPALARIRAWRRLQALPPLLTALLCGAGFVHLRAAVGEARFAVAWIPSFGAQLSLRLDGLAFLFVLLVTGIGALVIAFSFRYAPHDFVVHHTRRRLSTYYAYLLLFLGSMLGLVLADDLIILYVFWEATSITSFLLIGIHLKEEKARAAALQAFTLTAGAGLILFVAFLLLAAQGKTTAISALLAFGEELALHPTTPAIGAGILLGAIAKSAQVPFHIWLPNAMVAPTPVSAYLHSATMVAAGVFLLARLAPLLSPAPTFDGALVLVGTATLLFAGLVAITRHQLKEILAWSTISQYGYATLLLGLNAWGAALFLIATHAVIKAGLFLCAGVITRATGESDLRRLGNLWRSHPLTTACTTLLAAGLAGLPLTGGFWMKELFYRSVAVERLPWLTAAALAAGVLTLIYMYRFVWRTFVSGPRPRRVEPEKTLLPLLVPPAILLVVTLVTGFVPQATLALTDPAAASAAAAPWRTDVALHWPPDIAFLLSILTWILGAVCIVWLQRRERLTPLEPQGPLPHQSRPALPTSELTAAVLQEIGPRKLWNWSLPSLDAFGRFAAHLQSGKLVHYMLWLIAVPVVAGFVLLTGVTRWPRLGAVAPFDQTSLAFATLALAAVGLAVGAALLHSHVGAILMVGGVGFVLALIFAMLRAPDVALVQVAVETVTSLLLLILLSRIQITLREEAMSPQGLRSRAARTAAVIGAATVGATAAAMLVALQANRGGSDLAQSFYPLAEALQSEAVVTTILVDFRGFDTLGEITVFFAAVLGGTLLLARGPAGRPVEKGR